LAPQPLYLPFSLLQLAFQLVDPVQLEVRARRCPILLEALYVTLQTLDSKEMPVSFGLDLFVLSLELFELEIFFMDTPPFIRNDDLQL